MSSSPHSRSLAVGVVTATVVALGGMYYSHQETKAEQGTGAEAGTHGKEAARIGSSGVVEEMSKTKLPGKPSERSLRG